MQTYLPLHTPPENVQQELEARRGDGEDVLLWISTDIDLDGSYGERWLAFTSERIAAIAPNGRAASIEHDVPLRNVSKIEAINRIGYVALEIEADGVRSDLARASNSRAGILHQIARSINEREKHYGVPKFDIEEDEAQFCKTCGRLLPDRGGFCPHCVRASKVVGRLWHYLKPYWTRVAVMAVLVGSGIGFNIAPPYLTKLLVDRVLAPPEGQAAEPSLLPWLVLALAVLMVMGALFRIGQGRIAAEISSRMMHDVRFELYQSIQAFTFRRFDKTQVGTLMSRLLHDTERLNFMLIDFTAWVVPMIGQLVGIVVVLFVMDWFLAIWMLVPLPAVVLALRWFHIVVHRMFHHRSKQRDRMSAVANDSLSGLRVVKAFAQEPREIGRFEGRSIDVYRSAARIERTFSTFFPVYNVMIMTGSMLVWYFGGKLVLGHFGWHGAISLGTLMAFLGYLNMFYGPMDWIMHIGNHINQAITSAQRLFELIDAEQEIYDDPNATKMPEVKGKVEFRDVRFGYRKDKEVLKGVSLDVEPGEMIGLVGRSGVGKTTMTNLICRFYDVDEGGIYIDGVNMKDINISDLRKQIGIVPQESFLFNGTIAENISYAKPGATRKEIIRAAMASNSLGFILRQPDGFDSRVGEHGGRLSGGEKQRIAIARAILHDPRILILDEATSSVDTETEDQIQTALRRLVKGRTTFAIAHRLSTLKYANRLVVLEDGDVVEIGSHDELMEKKGVYARLVQMQSKLSAIRAVNG